VLIFASIAVSQNVTLKDIALKTNLSIGAVSKALAGYPQVSQATRQKVQEASDELNYQPRSRSRGRVRRVDPTTERRIKFFLTEQWGMSSGQWLPAMARASQRVGLRLEISYLESKAQLPADATGAIDGKDDSKRQAGEPWFQGARRIAGDIQGMLPFGCFDLPDLYAMAGLDIPCVVVGDMSLPRSGHALPVHWVSTDKIAMGQLATRTLIQQGHQRIAFFCGKQPRGGWNHQWNTGYRMALLNANFPLDPALQVVSHLTDVQQIALAAAQQLTSLPSPPTAYVCPSIDVASSFKKALHDRGIEILPSQMAIGGHMTDARNHGLENFPLIHEPVETMAIHSLDLLSRLIDGEALPPAEILVPFATHHIPSD
jgi:LacI family transcriptional regulator